MKRAKSLRKNFMTTLKGRNDSQQLGDGITTTSPRESSTNNTTTTTTTNNNNTNRRTTNNDIRRRTRTTRADRKRSEFIAASAIEPSPSFPPPTNNNNTNITRKRETSRNRTKPSTSSSSNVTRTNNRSKRIRDTPSSLSPPPDLPKQNVSQISHQSNNMQSNRSSESLSTLSTRQQQTSTSTPTPTPTTTPTDKTTPKHAGGVIPDYQKIAKAAQALDDAGNTLFEKGMYDQAMHSYTRALKLKRRTLKIGGAQDPQHKDNLLASVATSINNIGYLRQRSGATSEEIMSAYQDSLQIKKEILGPNDLSVGKTLNNIGSVYFTKGHFQSAMLSYCQALHIMEVNLGKTHLDVATVHSNIGDVHMARRELEQARQRYSDALKIRWSRLGDTDPKVIRLLEKVAAIEMADTPQKIKKGKLERQDSEDSADVAFVPQVQKDLRSLRKEVRNDMVYVDKVKRELALDMVKDKIRMIKGMRSLDMGEDGDDHLETTSTTVIPTQADDTSIKSAPLTPNQREEALASVKDRLARLRERKRNGGDASITSGASLTGSVMSYASSNGNYGSYRNITREASSRSMLTSVSLGRQISTRSILSDTISTNTGSSGGGASYSSSIQELKNRHEKLLSVKDRLDKIRIQKATAATGTATSATAAAGCSISVDSGVLSGSGALSDSVGSFGGSSSKSRDFRDRHVGEIRPSSRAGLAQYLESTK